MFEAAELGRKVSKEVFAKEEPEIHTALLNAQRELRKANIPAIIPEMVDRVVQEAQRRLTVPRCLEDGFGGCAPEEGR